MGFEVARDTHIVAVFRGKVNDGVTAARHTAQMD